MLTRETLERVEMEPGEPLPFVQEPLVVAAFQELARIQLDRFLEPPRGQGPLQLLDVERSLRTPLERPRPLGLWKRAAQGVEQLAQVGVGLAFGQVRPQKKCQTLTDLRGIAVQQQVGQQRFGADGIERRKGPVPKSKTHGAEQPGVQGSRVHQTSAPTMAQSSRHRPSGYQTHRGGSVERDGGGVREMG